jgi:hypothetical protein
VRALEGPSRVAPEDPGGLLVAHQGLTVNEVVGSQISPAANDPLQLAPRPINLQAEDQPIQALATRESPADAEPASVVLPEPVMEGAAPLIIDDTAERLAAMLATGTLQADANEPPAAVIPASAGGGLTQSLRPRLRPFVQVTRQQPRAAPVNIPAGQIARGAPMAQLGAFGSSAIAQQAWADLSERHGDYLVGKPHVILRAEVSGGTIYRLRVHGFADQEDARRLCTALNRQNAECYSVTMN